MDDLFAISLNGDFIYLLSGYAISYFSDYGFSGDQLYKNNDNELWIHTPIVDLLSGASDVYFFNDNLGFMISSEMLFCDCCYVVINKTIDGYGTWTESYNEETDAANCHANVGYADIIFPNETVGYALLGSNLLKTPYIATSIEDFNDKNDFTIYPNPITNSTFNLKINSTNTQGHSLDIFDIGGKKIYSEKELKKDHIISISNISEGIYFVKLLKKGEMVASRKLIKK